jgi:hypothetical protein
MKTTITTTLGAGLLALLAAGSAFGQQRLTADIPFEFRLADKVMPAGHYDVTLSGHNIQGLLSLSCLKCSAHAFAQTHYVGGGNTEAAEGTLVFSKYGDSYFLSQVWPFEHGRQGSALSKSRTEREIARIGPPAQTSQIVLARR